MDPSQNLGNQVLSVTNNIKEKLSVIIAYFHLNFGIVCKALNMIYFGQWQKLIFDVITGFWIFLGLIGYMIVLIYVKWWFPVDPYRNYFTEFTVVGGVKTETLNPYYIPADTYDKSLFISTSPSIITLMIGDIMGLVGLSDPNNESWQFYDNQQAISNILVYIVFIALPLMLCAIPCLHICCGPKHEVPEEFV